MVDINKLIQNIKNEKLKKYFRMSFYEIKDSNLPMGESFLNEFKKDLLELFPNTYSDLEHYILNKDIFSYSNLLEDTLRLEHGYYNYKDISTIKNIPKGSYWWNSEYATWEYYYKGIEEGFYTFNDLINFLNDNMEYFEYLVSMFIEKGEEKEYEYLCNMIEEAKLQDNIRFTIFNKVFSGNNSSCILYFIKKINEKNYYRHKALKEATSYYCEYPLNFDNKQVIKIIEDAFNYKYEDYITSGFRKNYCFIKTLRKYNVNKYNEYIKEVLSTDNEMANIAVLSFYKYYKKVHNEELKFKDIVPLILEKETSFEQLSYFPIIEIEDYNKVQAKQIFDYLLPYYDKMDKVNYHFKMTEDFPSAHDLSKTDMIKNLSKLAAIIDNKEVYDLLEQRTQTMGEEALSYFIEILQSSINMRKYAIQLIKSEHYYANKVYNSLNITLSLDEAKIVSDYLKTKKESVKRQIIKEFEKSKEKKEIAYYLISCKEDYKIKIGEEMISSLGLKKDDNKDKDNNIKIEDKIKKFYKNTNINLQKVNFISYKKIVSFYEKLEKFINNHKDYEYSTSNSDTTITFGSMFVKLKFGDFSYENYPLGKELKEEFTSFFTDEELITFVHCIADSICVSIKYKKYCDKKIIEYFQGICKSHSFKISLQLLLMLIHEFVDKKKLLNILVSIKCNYHDFILNNTHTDHMIVDMYKIVNDLKDEESLKLWSYLLVNSIEKDSSKLASWKVFAICVNEGVLDFDFIKYYIINFKNNYKYINDLYDDSQRKVLSLDNPNYEYLEFKKHMLTFMNEAVDAEVNRGAKDTIYSNYIFRLDKFYGVEAYLKALNASRNITLVRGACFWGTAKNINISKILHNTKKIDTDTYEKFLELVNKYNFTKEELIKACLYNTSFIDYIDRYLNIPNFKLIIYYFIAHLNESLNDEKKEIFKQYSVIDYHDFKDGAFDHEWYEEMVKNLSKKDFKIIYDNVKYITVAGLHKRAQRFYDAKNNKINLEECKAKIEGTRNKDYVLIYSLIPLKDNNDLYERFIYIQEFLKESKKFGAQRQVSERRVVDIALDNLARLGGYIDTNLFIYEMEASKQIDVSDSLEVDDIVLKTKFDHLKIVIETYKNDKLIKLPTKYNKNDKVLEFKELVKEQQTKLKRITKSFEETMCNNISFTYDNIIKISKDQVIKYILSKLILLSDGKVSIFKEDHIEDLNGNVITPNNIYIAHPIELYKNNCLNEAINYIITNNIKQPFKQILREFYTKSEQELQQQSCIRFRGFNVDIKKAIAALKSKSWGISEDVGLRKVFYYTNTIAILFREFDDFYYDDYEDYNRELHSITFINRKTEEIIDLKDVNDITYSECLRDVDLMISISSNTIYDYELAMSTTEMRQAVLKSIIQILKLNNISLLKDNIKIEGHYGNYIINIRTGLVYMEGKGNLLVDTIYSSNKALLLDFVDEDPMTADIISKAIVLSNDKDIKASSILMQIK